MKVAPVSDDLLRASCVGVGQKSTPDTPPELGGCNFRHPHVKGALGSETSSLATTRTISSSVSSCNTADQVGYSANEVAYAANEVGHALSTVKQDITAIASETSTLKTAWSTLQAKEAALPTYLPADQPASTAVTDALAAAQAAIAQAVSTTNGYIAQANADVKAAGAVASQAERSQGCSTTTVKSWTPLPTITG